MEYRKFYRYWLIDLRCRMFDFPMAEWIVVIEFGDVFLLILKIDEVDAARHFILAVTKYENIYNCREKLAEQCCFIEKMETSTHLVGVCSRSLECIFFMFISGGDALFVNTAFCKHKKYIYEFFFFVPFWIIRYVIR